jgi:hypothetical protein
MFLLNFLTVFVFWVDAHIKFTECQAEYYRNQPGNEDVIFETDGQPCQNKRKRRGLISENYWDNILQDNNMTDWPTENIRWNDEIQNGN